ncbi:TPA: RelA/SpoT domain-containing protein [Enterobacter ludwigii]|nr:RelA/SpoT domain-containing protein [Enterobacter ludwigii]
MSNYDEFHQYLLENQDAFATWGKYVSETIIKKIQDELGTDSFKSFLKIPVTPRVKEVSSALGKVARKAYEDPINQMTDLVGTRFVVLLSEDIDTVCQAIESLTEFDARISKNYLDEIELNPKLFDYQSKHYEIRPKNELHIGDLKISKQICCEVQVRTLLQHAYAELVHDSVYKPVGIVPKSAERHIARSMALMETTDDLFCSTMKLLYETNVERNKFNNSLSELYREFVGTGYMHYDESTNFLILDAFKEFITTHSETEIRNLLKTKKFIVKKIQHRSSAKTLFSQPSVLFVYFLIKNTSIENILNNWPLPGYIPELELLFSDLGVSSRR